MVQDTGLLLESSYARSGQLNRKITNDGWIVLCVMGGPTLQRFVNKKIARKIIYYCTTILFNRIKSLYIII